MQAFPYRSPCSKGSTRSDVSIAQHVGLELQIIQTMPDYIADADDAGEFAVAQHRHMAHPMACHQVHYAVNTLVRGTISRSEMRPRRRATREMRLCPSKAFCGRKVPTSQQ